MRKQRQEESGESWMNTYADLVTLLLTFFVLLFSMSAVDAEKWERFAKAFSNPGDDTAQIVINAEKDEGEGLVQAMGDSPPPGQGEVLEVTDEMMPADFNELYEFLKSYAESQDMGDSVEISEGENAVYIRFQNNLFFRPDSATLLQTALPTLEFLGDCLNAVEDEVFLVNINGHTAEVPGATYGVSDWMLSSERAGNIAIYLEEQKGISPSKLRPIGFGKNYPVASNDTEEGREQNRRVDITILSTDSELATNESLQGLFDPSKFPISGGVQDLLIPEENKESSSDQSQSQVSEPAESVQSSDSGSETADTTSSETAPPADEGT